MPDSIRFDQHIIRFLQSLHTTLKLPEGVDWIYPFENPNVLDLASQFYSKFYSDQNDRYFLFGINPGRLGAGMTGVPFTDPILLESKCDIPNDAQKKHELSSLFIYEMIDYLGGVDWFFNKYYITSICPLGFIKDKKNYNYYDSQVLYNTLHDYIVENIEYQINKFCRRDKSFSLGQGKNYKIFVELNKKYNWFDEVIPLPHPRWVMQYKRKNKKIYLDEYLLKLKN